MNDPPCCQSPESRPKPAVRSFSSPTKFIKNILTSPMKRSLSNGSPRRTTKKDGSPRRGTPKKDKGPTPLHRMAKQRNWDEISFFLRNREPTEVADWLEQCATTSRSPIPGASPLHVVLLYQPPLHIVEEVIQALMQAYPGAVPEDSIEPNQGRTPLHIAVATGCSCDIIERLYTHTAIRIVDDEQRTPLHWACTADLRRTGDQTPESIVRMLLARFPRARKMEDQFTFTPFQIARYHQAAPDLLQMLLPDAFLHSPQRRERGEAFVEVEFDEDDSTTQNDHDDIPRDVFTTQNDHDDIPRDVFSKNNMGNISMLSLMNLPLVDDSAGAGAEGAKDSQTTDVVKEVAQPKRRSKRKSSKRHPTTTSPSSSPTLESSQKKHDPSTIPSYARKASLRKTPGAVEEDKRVEEFNRVEESKDSLE